MADAVRNGTSHVRGRIGSSTLPLGAGLSSLLLSIRKSEDSTLSWQSVGCQQGIGVPLARPFSTPAILNGTMG
jgi:hypothetical protein